VWIWGALKGRSDSVLKKTAVESCLVGIVGARKGSFEVR